MIRIRVHAGLAFFQYRDHLVSDGLMMGFCDSLCYWTLTVSLEWRMCLWVVNIFLLVGIFNSPWYLWAYHYVVVQLLSHVRLCNPMECSTPGFPVLHHLTEFAQTHVHWISNVIQPSCLLSTTSPPAIFPSIRIFSNESALHIRWPKYWSFSNSPSNEYSGLILLGLTGLISLQSKGLSRVFSSATVQKHQFFLLSLLYGPALTSVHDYCKNHDFDYMDLCRQSNVFVF